MRSKSGASLDGFEERTRLRIKKFRNAIEQSFPHIEERSGCDWRRSHALKVRSERLLEIAWLVRRQHLCGRFGAAGEISEERSPQSCIEVVAVQKRLHVEKVARVLARQRCRELAGIKVCEVEHLHLGKSEFPFDSWPHAHCPHWMAQR